MTDDVFHAIGFDLMPKLPVIPATLPRPEIGRPDVLLGRAIQAEQHDQLDQAIQLYQTILRIDPTFVHAINRLGVIAGKSGDLGTALRRFADSLRIDPNQPEAWYNLGIAQSTLGLTREALESAERMIALSPRSAQAHFQRASTLAWLGRFEEAVAAFDETARLMPNDPGTAVNRGLALQGCGRYAEALSEFDRAIALNADFPDAWVSKSQLMLLLGDLPGGFALHEWRWRMPAWLESPRRPQGDYTQSRWLGETGIAGKTLFLVSDGGLGDTLQFCRYATMAAEAGAHVIVGVPNAIASLMRTLKGVERIVTDGEAVPEYDLNCAMMSLPLAFGTTRETIPASIPYLHAEASGVAQWRDRLSGLVGRRVGLVWAGKSRPWDPIQVAGDQRRSVSLAALGPLASIPDCDFISLQLGEPAKQAANPPAGMVIHDFTQEISTFADTAALVANLDLVISVDTSTAHLAGAMGQPVWLLNRFDTCWRWFPEREDSPWYPSMRIFRQPRSGDWQPVVRAVAEALRTFARG
jgi:tetratricopeptide (TPR) repeat protein